ncbi:hypothetical protein VTO42DRAFT_4711 [Malbranchea cinnamomea]
MPFPSSPLGSLKVSSTSTLCNFPDEKEQHVLQRNITHQFQCGRYSAIYPPPRAALASTRPVDPPHAYPVFETQELSATVADTGSTYYSGSEKGLEEQPMKRALYGRLTPSPLRASRSAWVVFFLFFGFLLFFVIPVVKVLDAKEWMDAMRQSQ